MTQSHQAKCPSSRSIAFAISIVRSKPPELSIREYIKRIRDHIVQEQSATRTRQLDRSAFWQCEYERTKDALRASEDEVVRLKSELEKLKSGKGSSRPSSRKSKRGTERSSSPLKDAKRPRTSDVEEIISGIQTEISDADAGPVGEGLVQSLIQVQYALSHSGTDSNAASQELAFHLQRSASSLSSLITSSIEQSNTLVITGAGLLRTTLKVCARAIALLLVAISRFSMLLGSDFYSSQVVYAYVKTFSTVLDGMGTISAHEAVRHDSSTETKLRTIPGLNNLAVFLASTIGQLDCKSDLHKSLFEGMAFAVIERVSSTLFASVFGHPKGKNVEEEIDLGTRAEEADEHEANEKPEAADIAREQAKLEAPYLVHLLSKVLGQAPGFMNSTPAMPSDEMLTLAPRRGRTRAVKQDGPLIQSARHKLQRTLVNCLFGHECAEIRDALRRPVPPADGEEVAMPKGKKGERDLNSGEWFSDQVWKLVGWDVLSTEY
ncbi:hypothetical protein K470DRAFT_86811 [Piedraia hortae CBS 480.64]|uniref:Uncharacterized protein n=1 Tax=Piedraia hortae CBS 480.64 TaxID=1314780 RepID=A0A6A7BY60_9PEZI|nr:hypothetical protein K470DRAFT_86811 [Piedraia hortae CBS 480.64]